MEYLYEQIVIVRFYLTDDHMCVVYDMGVVMIAIGLHPIVVFMSGQDKDVNWM